MVLQETASTQLTITHVFHRELSREEKYLTKKRDRERTRR